MSEWLEKRISDIAEVIAGGTPSTTVSDYWDGGISWITPNDLSSHKARYISRGERNITEEGLKKSAAKLLPRNTLLLTTRAPIGYLAIAEKEISTNQGFKNLICDNSQIDCRFFYYYIKLNVEYFKAFATGATFPELSGGTLKRIKVLIPDLPTQTRIAEILSAYDDAIENNNRRIALLEKAARELYREWFVRFRFPGYESAKFVNGLPEGWERTKFKGNISYITGKLDSNEMIADGRYSFYTCAKVIYKTDSYCFDGECVLLGGNNATVDFSLFYANEKLDAYQRTYIVTPLNDRISCPYIYFVLVNYLQAFKTSSTGAATKFLTKRMLDNFYIILPPKDLSDEHYRISKALFDERINLQRQSQNHARQRNLLLPRLMSGKLEV